MDEAVDLDLVEPPAGAIQFAYYLAHQSFPISTLWRIYHIATAKFLDQCLRELFESVNDPPSLSDQTTAISALIHDYVDKVCIRIGQTYDAERERWLRSLDIKRVEKISDLLTGRPVDLIETERILGYRVRQRDHIALVVWDVDAEFTGQSLQRLQRTVARCAELVRCSEAPLWLAQSTTAAWAWLPIPKADWQEASHLLQQIKGEIPKSLRVAVGERESDIEGFVRSHRQAVLAQSVAHVADPDQSQVTMYRTVGGLSFLCRDLDAAREWVKDTIGALAVNDEGTARVRETLEVYLDSNGSLSTAAKQLGCHKNTVAYRLRKAEEALGHPVASRKVDITFALHAVRWLGSVLLHA